MRTVLLLVMAVILAAPTLHAQVKGNAIYGEQQRQVARQQTVMADNSSLRLEAKVLINVPADAFVVTIGANEVADDLTVANTRIDQRIQAFTRSLKRLGIQGDETYVDMISYNPIYDFEIVDSTAQEVLKGFEIKKNVIISYTDSELLDDIITAAAQEKIYNVVKVDYIVTDPEAVYDQLYKEAKDIIAKKTERYAELNGLKVKDDGLKIVSETFQHDYPPEHYESYKAFEGGSIKTLGGIDRSLIVKELRKNGTFYYDRLPYHSYDRVIHPVFTEPRVQFSLSWVTSQEVWR